VRPTTSTRNAKTVPQSENARGDDVGKRARRDVRSRRGRYGGERESDFERRVRDRRGGGTGRDTTTTSSYFAIHTATNAGADIGCRESYDTDGDGRDENDASKSTTTATTTTSATNASVA